MSWDVMGPGIQEATCSLFHSVHPNDTRNSLTVSAENVTVLAHGYQPYGQLMLGRHPTPKDAKKRHAEWVDAA